MASNFLDLHGLDQIQAISKVVILLDNALRIKIPVVHIITGKGNGALFTTALDLLIKENYEYSIENQGGEIIVFLQREFKQYYVDDDEYYFDYSDDGYNVNDLSKKYE
ncbi:Smr/MutS family protein [Mycoplasmopsis columbinasalis]|uniref:Smr domain-containing protein n=1 Tax=Mycoplasmopsis columbinasalis TaxID=114880 RepID=A0A449B9L1_9BACT|nr:Smr/MutS family protein [Mycoplasmopsis columbinasalis]VEU77858.1 Smr domain-containing protein [Mycoplasmopsis columbinasalis]